MSKSTSTNGALTQKAPARKRAAVVAKPAVTAPRKTASPSAWATETFKRIEALHKALDGQQLA
jgi:hypothetical protein